MRKFGALATTLFLAMGVGAQQQSSAAKPTLDPTKKIEVMGTLTRVMAIGAESTGWAVKIDPLGGQDGQDAATMEVRFSDPAKAEKFENKYVKVSGKVTYRHGVETGDQPVLQVDSIKGAKPPKPSR